MQPIVTLLKYYIKPFLLNYNLSWQLPVYCKKFNLQISCINLFSGCSHCLEASQVVCDANRLTGFSLMTISFEGSSRAVSKMIFFVNRIRLLLPIVCLALMFLIFMVDLVIFMLYCLSTLVCFNLVVKSSCRFAYFDFGSTFIDAVPWSVFLTILSLTDKKHVFWKISVRLIWSNIVRQWEFSTANILFLI